MKPTMSLASDMDLIQQTAQQMLCPDRTKQQILDPKNKNPFPVSSAPYWSDLSIAGGYPGVLPLFVELDRLFPQDKWDAAAHKYIVKIKEVIESEGIGNLSIFGGLAGICFYVRQASKGGTRYRNFLSKLDAHLTSHLRAAYLEPFVHLLERSQSIPARYYETIYGLSGIGIYLLTNLKDSSFASLLYEIMDLLIALTRPRVIEGHLVPGWHVPCDSLFLEEDKLSNPKGNFNLGLSHGVPGVLAFLSIAALQGIQRPGQGEAMERIVSWLVRKRYASNGRFFWPGSVSFEEEVSSQPKASVVSRDAWCYGTPGVARSLYLAGQALQDESLKQFALTSFLSIFASKEEEWQIPCPTFCHGISGLLLIAQLMARDSQSIAVEENVSKLRTLLLSHHSSSALFGFKTLDPMRNGQGFARVDRCDLLEGTAGILLTLLSLHTNGCSWHLPFLIDSERSAFAP